MIHGELVFSGKDGREGKGACERFSSGLYGEQGFHFTYARNDLGRIMALGDEPGLAGGDWANLGRPGGVIARAEGVAATFETWANDAHVFAVGEDGNLYEGVTDSSYEVSWTQWPAPSGKVLTGHLAAGTFTNAGLTYVVVAATTTDGLLYRWTREVSSGTAAWADVGGVGRLWLTTTPLAATSNQAQTVLSFFATIDEPGSGANSLGMHRLHLDGSATTTSQGNPGYSVCGSLSAAQGQITSTVYRLYVACASDVSSNQIAFAWSDSATNDTLTWLTQSLSSTLPIASGNIAASVYRADGTNGALDMYYLGDDGQLRRTSRTSAGLQNPVELGPVSEASLSFGGMTAATAYETQAYSRVLFVGQRDDAYGVDAHYLYERSGRLPASASEYQNYGAGDPHQVVASGEKYAEGMLAEYGGTAALAIMERPGNGGPQDWPLVSVTRSYNDYDTVDPITVLPTNLGGVAYDYIVDPTVGVTDQNRTYVSELAEQKNTCSGSVDRGAAYLLTATRGSSTWTPILIRDAVSTNGNVPLDHPAMDIEHVAGGPDRVHVAWFMTPSAGPNAAIEYAVLTEGSTSQPPHYIIGDENAGEPSRPTTRTRCFSATSGGNPTAARRTSRARGATSSPSTASGSGAARSRWDRRMTTAISSCPRCR